MLPSKHHINTSSNANTNEWTEIPQCPVYLPSKHEFDDPFLYLQNIAPQVSKYGMCKVVSPISARVPARVVLTKETKDFKFETTVQPLSLGKTTFFRRGRKYTYGQFESMASNKLLVPHCSSIHLEKEFWLEMANGKKGSVEYGINIEGSAFSSHLNDPFRNSKWNLKNISRLPKSSLRFLQGSIPGITDPMLYIGMQFSMFSWHVEDHYLYSGAPKTWYGVPADFASELEKMVLNDNDVYTTSPESEDEASKLLAEKTTMFSPQILIRNNVPVFKAVQMPGEFVITFPKAYHAGFSHGFNCGEAVNFAMSDWFPFGTEANERYALLKIAPIIPHEELVCKEAMFLYEFALKDNEEGTSNREDNLSTKRCFVRLVRFYEQALQRSSSVDRGSSSVKAMRCKICNRESYLAYMICNSCHSYSVCLNHVWDVESEWVNCGCGNKISVYVREDIEMYIEAAHVFEKTLLLMETKANPRGKAKECVMKIRRMKGVSQIHSKL